MSFFCLVFFYDCYSLAADSGHHKSRRKNRERIGALEVGAAMTRQKREVGAPQFGKTKVRAQHDPNVRTVSSVAQVKVMNLAQVKVMNWSLLQGSVFISKGNMTPRRGHDRWMGSVVPQDGWYWLETGSPVGLACLLQKWPQEPLL